MKLAQGTHCPRPSRWQRGSGRRTRAVHRSEMAVDGERVRAGGKPGDRRKRPRCGVFGRHATRPRSCSSRIPHRACVVRFWGRVWWRRGRGTRATTPAAFVGCRLTRPAPTANFPATAARWP
eukprot:ctg_122.g65